MTCGHDDSIINIVLVLLLFLLLHKPVRLLNDCMLRIIGNFVLSADSSVTARYKVSHREQIARHHSPMGQMVGTPSEILVPRVPAFKVNQGHREWPAGTYTDLSWRSSGVSGRPICSSNSLNSLTLWSSSVLTPRCCPNRTSDCSITTCDRYCGGKVPVEKLETSTWVLAPTPVMASSRNAARWCGRFKTTEQQNRQYKYNTMRYGNLYTMFHTCIKLSIFVSVSVSLLPIKSAPITVSSHIRYHILNPYDSGSALHRCLIRSNYLYGCIFLEVSTR